MSIRNIKNLKEFSTANERFEGSHLMCPGCAHTMIVRELMNATDSVIPIVERLNVGKQTNLLRVILKADAGQTMGTRINYLFKKVLKSI